MIIAIYALDLIYGQAKDIYENDLRNHLKLIIYFDLGKYKI